MIVIQLFCWSNRDMIFVFFLFFLPFNNLLQATFVSLCVANFDLLTKNQKQGAYVKDFVPFLSTICKSRSRVYFVMFDDELLKYSKTIFTQKHKHTNTNATFANPLWRAQRKKEKIALDEITCNEWDCYD